MLINEYFILIYSFCCHHNNNDDDKDQSRYTHTAAPNIDAVCSHSIVSVYWCEISYGTHCNIWVSEWVSRARKNRLIFWIVHKLYLLLNLSDNNFSHSHALSLHHRWFSFCCVTFLFCMVFPSLCCLMNKHSPSLGILSAYIGFVCMSWLFLCCFKSMDCIQYLYWQLSLTS